MALSLRLAELRECKLLLFKLRVELAHQRVPILVIFSILLLSALLHALGKCFFLLRAALLLLGLSLFLLLLVLFLACRLLFGNLGRFVFVVTLCSLCLFNSFSFHILLVRLLRNLRFFLVPGIVIDLCVLFLVFSMLLGFFFPQVLVRLVVSVVVFLAAH